MEQINVNPLGVRGFGDIVDSKVVGDFLEFNSNLSSSDGVYSSSYLAGSSITLVNVRRISSSDSSFTVSATLKNSSNTAISDATLYCNCNGTVTSETTNASGVASFTVDTDDSDKYSILVYYQGTSSISGSFANTSVYVSGTATNLDLHGNKEIIQTNDKLGVWVNLTDAEGKGVPLGTVSFYETFTPGVRVSAPSVIQSGAEVDLTATLVDADDGSIIRESGHTVSFYVPIYKNSVEDPTNVNVTIGDTYSILTTGTAVIGDINKFVHIVGEESKFRIKDSGGFSSWYTVTDPVISMDSNGILSYDDNTLDLSSRGITLTKLYSMEGYVIVW